MLIDLHIHSKSSDGKFSVEEIMAEAKARSIGVLSITDHDSTGCQTRAVTVAKDTGVRYVCGVELNVTFSHPRFRGGKAVSLDFLGYQFNPENEDLKSKLDLMAKYREERAAKILENLNGEFSKEGIPKLTKADLAEIEASVDGVLGRPHIADYLVKKKIVQTRQEAFDKYLVKCDVPKYPLYLEEASKLIRDAGGKLVLAHPNDPHGTSLVSLTKSLAEQTGIVESSMLDFIDGVEGWHSRHDTETTQHYMKFAKAHNLLITGGSDCHQKPTIMGTVPVPGWVADQFQS
ncbi:MAG: PHP domain-containing protein [Candidatus Bathyarchaeota archaeon]|nr:PHP domain-containing protein [Candidatus Bathyarchaeota archaeon]